MPDASPSRSRMNSRPCMTVLARPGWCYGVRSSPSRRRGLRRRTRHGPDVAPGRSVCACGPSGVAVCMRGTRATGVRGADSLRRGNPRAESRMPTFEDRSTVTRTNGPLVGSYQLTRAGLRGGRHADWVPANVLTAFVRRERARAWRRRHCSRRREAARIVPSLARRSRTEPPDTRAQPRLAAGWMRGGLCNAMVKTEARRLFRNPRGDAGVDGWQPTWGSATPSTINRVSSPAFPLDRFLAKPPDFEPYGSGAGGCFRTPGCCGYDRGPPRTRPGAAFPCSF